MNPFIKWVLIGSVGIVILFAIGAQLFMCPGGWTCPDMEKAVQVGERETIRTAIQAMMTDNGLSQVRANASGRGGEKILSTGTQFHDDFNLSAFMDRPVRRGRERQLHPLATIPLAPKPVTGH